MIRDILKVPKSTLSYWLRDLPLSEKRILEHRRKGWQKVEASRERYRNTMRLKKEQRALDFYNFEKDRLKRTSEDCFYIAVLIMLYLGEGNKKNLYSISVSSTDPDLINVFIKWLIRFFGVSKEQIKVQLHLYENIKLEK